ncbi:MAG TPA: murein biosynthesis integral membrane protein MurJ [Longimicrobiaceae bacterium]
MSASMGEGAEAAPPIRPTPSRGGGAASSLVAAGILLSRVSGLIRESVFAYYFGVTLYADVFRAGLRLPNALQNLLGEGTLSASFIPIYSELLERGKEEEAGRVAGAVFALLVAIAAALALFGIIFAPVLVSIFLAGFTGEKRELTITVTRIIFPMTGVLVLYAWTLGILNSHRKFFLSYVAPVIWSGAMIATMILLGGRLSLDRLVIALAWGALIGGLLQFLIQLPWVLRLERSLKVRWDTRLPEVRETVRNAGPAIMGRGVVQVSGYVDTFLATFLFHGALAAIGFAQVLYLLPVSLFGMSVAAAELPELARQRTAATEELRRRASAALQRIAFYVVPSFVAFVLLGDLLVAMLFQSGGEFDASDTRFVHAILIAFSIGLMASTGARLMNSTFFALRDTRTPARFATVRVVVAAVLAIVLMIQFEPISRLGIPAGVFAGVSIGGQPLGAVGLAAGSGIASWLEWGLLKRALRQRIGPVGAGAATVTRMFVAALAAAAAGWGVRLFLPPLDVRILGLAVVAVYGVVYFAAAAMLRLEEIQGLASRLHHLRRR